MWERLYYTSSVNSLLDVHGVDLYDYGLRAPPGIDNLFSLAMLFLSNLIQLLLIPLKLMEAKGLFFAAFLSAFVLVCLIVMKSGNRVICAFAIFVFGFLIFLVPDAGTLVRHMGALSMVLYTALVVGSSTRMPFARAILRRRSSTILPNVSQH